MKPTTGAPRRSSPAGALRLLWRLERRNPALFLGLLLTAALLLRLPYLVTRPFWLDEVLQFQISNAPDVSETLRRLVEGDRNPPGYALLLHSLLPLGQSEALLRAPSLIAGLLCVPAGWLLGRLWVGRTGGIVLAVLCVACPPYVFYAGEARPYSTGLLWIFGFLIATALHARRPSWKTAVLLAVTATLCVFWQYVSAVIVAAGFLGILAWSRPRTQRKGRLLSGCGVAGCLSAVVLAGCVLGVTRGQLQLRGSGTRDSFLASSFYQLHSFRSIAWFLFTQLPDFLKYIVLAKMKVLVFTAISGLLLGVGLLLGAAWALRRRGRGHALLLVAVGSLVALLLLAGLGLHPFGGIRHCLPLTPPLLLLFAAGCAWWGRRKPGRAALVVGVILVLMLVSDFLEVPTMYRFDFKEIVADLRQRAQPGDAVLAVGSHAVVFRHYYDQDPCLDRVIYLDRPLETERREAVGELQAQARSVLSSGRRLWTVAAQHEADHLHSLLKDLAIRQTAIDRARVCAVLWLRRDDCTRSAEGVQQGPETILHRANIGHR
jgi:hypothetical protein